MAYKLLDFINLLALMMIINEITNTFQTKNVFLGSIFSKIIEKF